MPKKSKQQSLRLYGLTAFTASQRGVALLPMILVLFGLVAVVGIAIAGISVSENTISSTKDASDEAFIIAESGIHDALMKLSRNKVLPAPVTLPAVCFGRNCYNYQSEVS